MKYKVGDILIQQWGDPFMIIEINGTHHRLLWLETGTIGGNSFHNDSFERDTYIGKCNLLKILYGTSPC